MEADQLTLDELKVVLLNYAKNIETWEATPDVVKRQIRAAYPSFHDAMNNLVEAINSELKLSR